MVSSSFLVECSQDLLSISIVIQSRSVPKQRETPEVHTHVVHVKSVEIAIQFGTYSVNTLLPVSVVYWFRPQAVGTSHAGPG